MGLPMLIRARDLVLEKLPWEDNPRIALDKWLKNNPNRLLADYQFVKANYISDGVGFVLYIHPESEGYYVDAFTDRRGITEASQE